MGLFSRSKKKSTLNWNALNNEDDLNMLIEKSHQTPCVIFKHSTRCSISSMALKRFEKGWNDEKEQQLYYLDLIQNKTLSNEVAQKFGVQHESPQLLLIEDGECQFHASHGAIDPEKIQS